MLTEHDKTIAAILIPLISFVNQKWGLSLPVDPATLSALVGLVTALVVYFVPNKVTQAQAAQAVAGVQLGTTPPAVKSAANVIVQQAKTS